MQDEMSGSQGAPGAGTGSGGAVTELKSMGKDAASTAKEVVQGLREQVTDRATEKVADRRNVLAESLDSVVQALRAAEKSLRDDNQEGLAAYSSSIASYVERSTDYVRNNDMQGLMGDLQRVGRENTGMFMGSSFAAGAALGRFLRASAPDTGSDTGYATPASEVGSIGGMSGSGMGGSGMGGSGMGGSGMGDSGIGGGSMGDGLGSTGTAGPTGSTGSPGASGSSSATGYGASGDRFGSEGLS